MAFDRSTKTSRVPVLFAEALTAMNLRKVANLVHLGRARWIDPEQRHWRHTFGGALCVCASFFKQLSGAMTQFWRVTRGPIAAPFSPRHDENLLHAFGQLNTNR